MAEATQSRFSFKSFGLGLAGVVAIYGCVFAYAAMQSSVTIQGLEDRLASEIITVSREAGFEPSGLPDHLPEGAHVNEHQAEIPIGEHLNPEDTLPTPEMGDITEIDDLIGHSAKSLSPAPLSGLYEKTAAGVLPIANASSGNTPFEAYRKPFVLNRDKPFLAIAVLDFGLSDQVSKQALAALPSEVSMILSPYSSEPDTWQKAARGDGHEIWMQMAAQTDSFPQSDPGPNAFLTNVSFSYNRDRLHWLLSRTAGYAGLAGFTDSTLSSGGAMFKNLVNEVFDRGLGYFELNTTGGEFVKDIAMDRGLPYTATVMDVKDLSAESRAVQAIEARIASQGGAVIVVNPTLKNLEDLKNWIRRLESRGIQIAPISTIAALNGEG